jgi:hypothetical protein
MIMVMPSYNYSQKAYLLIIRVMSAYRTFLGNIPAAYMMCFDVDVPLERHAG